MKFKITRKDQDIIASVMVFKEKWWLWVVSIKNLIGFGIPAALAVVLCVSYLTFHKPKRHGDYFAAARAYEAWVAGDESELTNLENLMGHHPELHAKYDHAIAAHLMATGHETSGYAESVFKRTNLSSKWHGQFSKTSLVISQGDYKLALHEACDLKNQMSERDIENNKLIYGFNLLRIASMERQLNHDAAEKQAVKELQSFLANHKNDKDLTPLVSHYQQGKVSLDDYLISRL